jgi:hypothetical protein
VKPHEGNAEQYARTIEAVYQSLAQLNMPALDNITALTELIEARESSLRAALADERKHAAVAWQALEDMRCTCERVTISGVWTALKCARCRALEAHDRRKEQAHE